MGEMNCNLIQDRIAVVELDGMFDPVGDRSFNSAAYVDELGREIAITEAMVQESCKQLLDGEYSSFRNL